MKKVILSIIFLFIAFTFLPSYARVAQAKDGITYAHMTAPTVLYSLEGESYEAKVILPQTYFVALTDYENEKDSDYLTASYLDISGFVPRALVSVCDYEPVTKYATYTASPANDGLPINLRDRPNHTEGKIMTTILPDATLICYGEISGSALIEQVGNRWFYVKYTLGAQNHYGYVYSAHVLAPPPPNNIIEKVPESGGNNSTVVQPPLSLQPFQEVIFICALSIPAVLVMFFIFKKPSNKGAQKRSRNSDRPL